MRSIVTITRRLFCDLNVRNKKFVRKLRRYQNQMLIHQKASKIDEKKMADYVVDTPKQKIAYQFAKRSDYDKELKDFIDQFNIKHKNKVTLLDFSNYTTQLGDLRDKPIRKEDIDMIKQFQKRKVDHRITQIRQSLIKKNKRKFPRLQPNSVQKQMFGQLQLAKHEKEKKMIQNSDLPKESHGPFIDSTQQMNNEFFQQGPFKIRDDFMIILLNVRSNTKVTTLNRINSYKTLLFMGNGNGVISHAKGEGANPSQSLDRALYLLKKNIIAIPRDSRVTLPLHIRKRFQDYRLYLRPVPGFNPYGHPIMAHMLTLAGLDHCGFHVSHTDKNVYNVLKVFFKAVTVNTTPQELAERQGFKIYRHQFIRPLTYVQTHYPIAGRAKLNRFRNYKIKANPNAI